MSSDFNAYSGVMPYIALSFVGNDPTLHVDKDICCLLRFPERKYNEDGHI